MGKLQRKSAASRFQLIFYFLMGIVRQSIVNTFLPQNFVICDRITIEYRKIRDSGQLFYRLSQKKRWRYANLSISTIPAIKICPSLCSIRYFFHFIQLVFKKLFISYRFLYSFCVCFLSFNIIFIYYTLQHKSI